jgi:hypothetical protein
MIKITKLPNGGEVREYPSGTKFWFLQGKYHREDGPAIEWAYGDGSWWINDKLIPCRTQKEFDQLMRLKAFW